MEGVEAFFSPVSISEYLDLVKIQRAAVDLESGDHHDNQTRLVTAVHEVPEIQRQSITEDNYRGGDLESASSPLIPSFLHWVKDLSFLSLLGKGGSYLC